MSAALERHAILERYPVFAGLAPERFAALFAQRAPLEVPAGTVVFREDQACSGFPLLLAGSIKVVKLAENGRELLLYRVEAGGSCIITSSCLLGQRDYNARGIAETALRLLPIGLDDFSRLLVEHPPFREFVFRLFAERIGELMQLVEAVAFARLDQRLARLLVAREDDVVHVTHQQLADELGSVREIVSRLLKSFAEQGLVRLGREQLTIIDRPALRRLGA